MLTEKERPENSYYLMFEFGSHHYIVLTDEDYFFYVLHGLNSEFEIKENYSDDGLTIEYSLVNYYGDDQFIGKVLKGVSKYES